MDANGTLAISTESINAFLGRPCPKNDTDFESSLSMLYQNINKEQPWVVRVSRRQRSRLAKLFLTEEGTSTTCPLFLHDLIPFYA